MRALATLAQEETPDTALQVLAVQTLARVSQRHARALAVELAVAAGL